MNIRLIVHPVWLKLLTTHPLLSKNRSVVSFSLEMTGLIGREGGSSAKVALSWQLSDNKAGQGSADVQQTEDSHLRAPPHQRAYESGMWSLTFTFLTNNNNKTKINHNPQSNKHKTQKIESIHVRVEVHCCQFPGVDESAYAAFQWQMAEQAFLDQGKKMQYIVKHLIISAVRQISLLRLRTEE